MLIVIAGKSGSGKSTLAKEYAKELPDCVHIDVDKVTHDVLDTIKDDLLILYSEKILKADGSINRTVLGDLIFSDREKYDSLVRPVWEKTLIIIDNLIASHKSAVVDHILAAHTKYWKQADLTIKVMCEEKKRIARIKKRDKITDEYLKKRESASPDFSKIEADLVVITG